MVVDFSYLKFADAESASSVAGAAAIQAGCDAVIGVWRLEGSDAYCS